MEENKKEIAIVPNREVLIKQHNDFTETLINAMLDYRRHLRILASDPSYEKPINPQQPKGEKIGIEELVNKYRIQALNARTYVEVIDELIKADDEGKLAEVWSDLDSIPVTLQAEGGEGAAEEATEETKA